MKKAFLSLILMMLICPAFAAPQEENAYKFSVSEEDEAKIKEQIAKIETERDKIVAEAQ